MILCQYCNREIEDDDIHRAYEDALCETCFNDSYTYCNQCNVLIERENVQYDNDGDPLCSSCYEEEYSDDAPENPEVTDADRGLIITLSRDWIKGKTSYKNTIKVNNNDYGLKGIKDAVGLVDQSLYVYGLKDREEYSITASPDIIECVRTYLYGYNIIETTGLRRLGLSYDLRANHQQTIVDLIKQLSLTQLAVSA